MATIGIFYIILAEKWIFHTHGDVVENEICAKKYFQDMYFISKVQKFT